MSRVEPICLFAVVLVWASIAIAETQGDCPTNYVFLAEKCYGIRHTRKSWADARSGCEGENAHLAEVRSSDQYEQILGHLNTNFPGVFWIGGSGSSSRQWTWANSGAPMMEMWWGGSHPLPLQNGCAYFCSITRRYWSSYCNVRKAYICETNPILPETEIEPQTPEDEVELLPIIPRVNSE